MAVDWSQFEPVSPPSGRTDWSFFEPVKTDGSDFSRGVKESFQQLPQLGYGAMAGVGAAGESMFGSGGFWSGVKRAGVSGYQEWGDKIASQAKDSDSWNYSWDQAKQGNFGALVDWLQHGLGYVGGQAVQMLATAGIGAVGGKFVAGTAAKQIAEGMVAKEAAKLSAESAGKVAAEDIARQATANVAAKFASAGTNAAMGATAIGMEGGEIFGDLAKRSIDEGRVLTGEELGKAFGATLAAGGLEFVGDRLGLDIILGKSPLLKPAASMGGLGGRVARGATAAAAQSPIEAATEYAQTMLEEFGKGGDAFSSETMKQAADAAALGALGGAAVGGLGGAVRGPTARPSPEDTPKADPIQAIGDANTIDEAIAATEQALDIPDSRRTPEQAIARMEAMAQGADRLGVSDWSNLPQSSMVEADWLREARAIAAQDQAVIAAEKRRAEIEGQPVERAPRQRTAAVEMQPADPVMSYVDGLRQTNTPAARAFVQDFDAGRITRADVEQRIARETPRTDAQVADERLAAAAAQAPKPVDGLLLTADGFPYGTRSGAVVRARREGLTNDSVIEVAGGYAVRSKEAPSVEPELASPAPVDAGAGPVGPGAAGVGAGTVRPVADDAIGTAGADTAPAGEGGAAGVQPGRGGDAGGSLTALKVRWRQAVARGDTQAAAEINQRIVDFKTKQAEPSPPVEATGVDRGQAQEEPQEVLSAPPAQEQAGAPAEGPGMTRADPAPAVENKTSEQPSTVMGMTEEQRRAAIDSETMEDRVGAPEVAQPTATKSVKVFSRTLNGIKQVRAKLYEIPGYKGPQLAVAEYKTSRGVGYRVYLPKSGAFITDSNGVSTLDDTLKLAVLRIQNARDTIKARKDSAAVAPTHADPGKPPETATAKVVSEAITKAAARQDVPRAEMKREALRLIDEAIEKAPSEQDTDANIAVGQPKTRMGKKEISGFRTFDGDRTVSLEARQSRDSKWTVTDTSYDGSGTGRRRNKLVGELVGTPAEAVSQLRAMLRRINVDGSSSESDLVEISVPGDGTFKVLNTKERLAEFRKKVEKSPGFAERQQATPAPARVNGYGMRQSPGSAFGVESGSGGSRPAIENMIDDGDPQAAVDYAAARGLNIAEVLRDDKARLKKVESLTPTEQGEQEAESAPAKPKADAAVSSVDGQKNLAYRGSRIAALLAMNEQIKKLDPTEAWHPDNITDATDLDGLQDSISSTLVRLQREKAAKGSAPSSQVNATVPTKPQPAPDGENAVAQGAVAPSLKDRVEALKPSREVIDLRKRAAVLAKLKACMGA